MLFVYEDIAAFDEILTLTVMWSTRDMKQFARETCLKNDQGISGVPDETVECRLEWHGSRHLGRDSLQGWRQMGGERGR